MKMKKLDYLFPLPSISFDPRQSVNSNEIAIDRNQQLNVTIIKISYVKEWLNRKSENVQVFFQLFPMTLRCWVVSLRKNFTGSYRWSDVDLQTTKWSAALSKYQEHKRVRCNNEEGWKRTRRLPMGPKGIETNHLPRFWLRKIALINSTV